jgi:hypothetical protein
MSKTKTNDIVKALQLEERIEAIKSIDKHKFKKITTALKKIKLTKKDFANILEKCKSTLFSMKTKIKSAEKVKNQTKSHRIKHKGGKTRKSHKVKIYKGGNIETLVAIILNILWIGFIFVAFNSKPLRNLIMKVITRGRTKAMDTFARIFRNSPDANLTARTVQTVSPSNSPPPPLPSQPHPSSSPDEVTLEDMVRRLRIAQREMAREIAELRRAHQQTPRPTPEPEEEDEDGDEAARHVYDVVAGEVEEENIDKLLDCIVKIIRDFFKESVSSIIIIFIVIYTVAYLLMNNIGDTIEPLIHLMTFIAELLAHIIYPHVSHLFQSGDL